MPDPTSFLSPENLLAFEREWEGRTGAKDAEIRTRFGVSSARYHQALFAALERDDVLQLDPMLVRRLQRLRDTRTDRRNRRSFT